MKTFLQICRETEQQYIDCIKIGFISGIGTLFIILGLFIFKQVENTQKAVIDYQHVKEMEVLREAENQCSGNLDFIKRTELNGKWQFEVGCSYGGDDEI